ncbi:hypothetical protein OCGS_0420 [Oceaniovalibus guishaninsula JLT2003]|uniref:YjiS-like domain-containing protein n=1 Tax=Oceaniovalibus guishaninsula JLT2003 TaxID=1231392 RepID=K2I8F1_9RHOB|nr:DUF1127 domain-containing protein [Oceaniovalibus guishaninsula]EKE45330.1 hypothetical protein OCGS_0420 [Oceaniovalibus guishaninsula JLT2003]
MTATTTLPHHAGFAERAAGIAAALRDRWTARRTFRRTVNELSDLSNRELADLGLCRTEIRHIALEAAYGPR